MHIPSHKVELTVIPSDDGLDLGEAADVVSVALESAAANYADGLQTTIAEAEITERDGTLVISTEFMSTAKAGMEAGQDDRGHAMKIQITEALRSIIEEALDGYDINIQEGKGQAL